MAHITEDRVLETTTSTGTGTLTLAGAVTGFRTFASVMATSDTCWYYIEAVDVNGNATGDYEAGLGTYSATNTLTRTTVLKSSNAGAVVTLAAGTKRVGITLIASRVVQLNNDLAMAIPQVGAGAIAAPSAGFLKIFARARAGAVVPKYLGPSGVDHMFQPHISDNGYSAYLPNNGASIGLNLGLGWTSGGTVSHPTPSSAAPAAYNQQKRTRWANVVTTTNQFLGLRTATGEKRYWRGNAAGLGGFFFHTRFGIGLWPAATVRLFVGLNDSNVGWAISDTLTGNGCGFWHDTTEAATVLTFVTRNGTTTTKSAAIPLTTALAAGQWFDAFIWSAPNGSVIGYALIDGANGNVLVDTTTSTTIPLNTAFLGQELAMSNGTANITATTVAPEVMAHSCVADN